MAAARAEKKRLVERMTVSLMIYQRTCFNMARNIGGVGSGWRGGGVVCFAISVVSLLFGHLAVVSKVALNK